MLVLRCLVLPVLIALVSGCGGGDGVEKTTITGKVTFDGEVVDTGDIVLEPVSGTGPSAGGNIKDGTFSIDCPVGEMLVRITAARDTGKTVNSAIPGETEAVTEQYIPECYNTQSKLEVTIDGSKSTHDFALTANCE